MDPIPTDQQTIGVTTPQPVQTPLAPNIQKQQKSNNISDHMINVLTFILIFIATSISIVLILVSLTATCNQSLLSDTTVSPICRSDYPFTDIVFIAFIVAIIINLLFIPYVIIKGVVTYITGTSSLSFKDILRLVLASLGRIVIIYMVFFFVNLAAAIYNPRLLNMGDIPKKPVIYLYPTKQQATTVKLEFNGNITSTYPTLDQSTHEWQVIAYPDGHLINQADKKEYSYLFWEGKGSQKYDLSKGFVIQGKDTATFLQRQLFQMGLTPKEYNEFIVYWLPQMEHNPYNLIHFATNEYTNQAKLTISPKPDSLLRIFMVFKPLPKPVTVQPQSFPQFQRKGFTVVEWGGSEIQ